MIEIHINAHFSIGVILASLFHLFFNFSLFEYVLILLFSFIMDFDLFFSKFTKDNNHRMLITHSILPSIMILVLSMIFASVLLFGCSIAYLIHVIVDSLDWGTNFFGIHKKPFGPKFLISKEELKNLEEILAKFKVKNSFFDFKYYNNKVVLLAEMVLVILMIVFSVIFALEYFFIIFLYLPFMLFHVVSHFHLKKLEKNNA